MSRYLVFDDPGKDIPICAGSNSLCFYEIKVKHLNGF